MNTTKHVATYKEFRKTYGQIATAVKEILNISEIYETVKGLCECEKVLTYETNGNSQPFLISGEVKLTHETLNIYIKWDWESNKYYLVCTDISYLQSIGFKLPNKFTTPTAKKIAIWIKHFETVYSSLNPATEEPKEVVKKEVKKSIRLTYGTSKNELVTFVGCEFYEKHCTNQPELKPYIIKMSGCNWNFTPEFYQCHDFIFKTCRLEIDGVFYKLEASCVGLYAVEL